MKNRNDYTQDDFSNREGFHDWTDRSNRMSSSSPRSFRESMERDSRPFEDNYRRSTSSDYDFNREGYRGDSSGFSGQGRNGVSRDDYYRTDFSPASRRSYDRDYPTRRALEDQEMGTNWNSPSRTQSRYRDEYRDNRDKGSGFSTNEGAFSAPYRSNWSSERDHMSYDTSSNSYERGEFTGRGPKGYRRSDDRIKEEVCDALERHPRIDASEIEVEVSEGAVTLSGSVDSKNTKRMIEDLTESLYGVKEVKNEIRVSAGDFYRSRSSETDRSDSTKSESMDYGKASKTANASRTSSTNTPSTGKSIQ